MKGGTRAGQYAAKPLTAYILGKLLRYPTPYIMGLVLLAVCPAAQATPSPPPLDLGPASCEQAPP